MIRAALSRIGTRLRRFRDREEGSIVVESALMFPTLFCACLATWVFFDAFRNQSINLKAAYTISDALSREEGYITSNYLTNLYRIHRFLTNSNYSTQLRVSVITYDEDDDKYLVCWSQARGGPGVLNQARLDELVDDDQIPVLPDGKALIVVQTWVTHEPIFSIGDADKWAFVFENLVVTAPRFAPQLKWSISGTVSGEESCTGLT